VPLLYRGKVSDIHVEPEACKGWIACAAVKEVLEAGEPVVCFDFEDSAKGIVSRLHDLGVSHDYIREAFTYVAPDEALEMATRMSLERLLRFDVQRDVGLAVLDGVTQAVSNQGGRSNDNDEIARFFREVPRVLTWEHKAAVLMIDHVTKDAGNTRYAIGAQTKLGAIDGASFFAEVRQPFGRGMSGQVDLWVSKDRPGYVRRHAGELRGLMQRIATVRLQSDEATGAVTVRLEPPTETADGPSDEDTQTALMGKVVRVLQRRPGLTKPELRADVPGGNAKVDAALAALCERGYVQSEKVGRAIEYHVLDADSLLVAQGAGFPATD
jgi:hypothetical protein